MVKGELEEVSANFILCRMFIVLNLMERNLFIQFSSYPNAPPPL